MNQADRRRLFHNLLLVLLLGLGVTLSSAALSESPIEARLLELATDPDPRVRFQAALSLGEVDSPRKVEALASIALQDGADPWVRSAILSSIGGRTLEFLERLIPEAGPDSAGVDSLVAELSKLLGTRGDSAAIERLVSLLSEESAPDSIRTASLKGLSEGIHLSGARSEGSAELAESLAELMASPTPAIRGSAIDIASKMLPPDSPALEELIVERMASLADLEGDADQQIQSARILRLASFEKAAETLGSLLSGLRPEDLQIAALESLSFLDRPEGGEMIIESWSGLAPSAKARAIDLFFSRSDRVLMLLEAIEAEKVPGNILDSQRRSILLSYSDPKVVEKAKTLFSSEATGEDPELYRKYAGAVELEGDRERGRKTYIERCAQCHIAEGEGHQLGPDWSALKSNTRETLLISILYPNREVDPGFTNYIVETFDGEIYTGVLAFSGPNSVILRRGGGQEDAILRKNIDILEDTKLSIMPTDLEAGLTTQDMADLLTFIESLD